MALDVVRRASVNYHFVIRFEHKGSVSIIHKSILDRNGIEFADIAGGYHAIGIFFPAGYIHTGGGSSILQATGKNDEVLDSRILGKRKCSWSIHHSGYCHGTLILEIEAAGNEKFVVVLKHKVRCLAIQDGGEI